MYKLIINEIRYFKLSLILVGLLLLIFTIFALSNTLIFQQVFFLKKFFWSMIVGLGTYGLVFFIWMQRVKEKHERIHNLLPVTNRKKSLNRWLFAILPFSLTLIYVQLLQFFLTEDWIISVGRISAQIGFLSMALASMFLVRDLWFVKINHGELFRIFIGAIIIMIATLGAIGITQVFSYKNIKPFYVHEEELLFFVWGLIISAATIFAYRKRKSYLE